MEEEKEYSWKFLLYGVVLLTGLYYLSVYNYLLFHTVSEFFSIVVSAVVFIIAWNTRHYLKNNYYLVIGLGLLFPGVIDLIHTMGYKGMNIFSGYDSNLPTQLWIAARYIQSLLFFLAPLLSNRKIHINGFFLSCFMTTLVLLFLIFNERFPDCYREGEGLTPFKIYSEYIISLIYLLAILLSLRIRLFIDRSVLRFFIASIIMSILTELFFTFYISVYGISNLLGHFFKIISFSLIYKAIIQKGFKQPYATLFRRLKVSEELLMKERNKLMIELDQVKNSHGLVSICAQCKSILNPKGEWKSLEYYFQPGADKLFTHGLCPVCEEKLYGNETWYQKRQKK